MVLIKCLECGKEISDKAEACPHCGCPVSAMTEPNTQKIEVTDDTVADNKKLKKKRKIKPWLFIAGAVVLLAVVVSIVISLLPSKYNWDEVILKSVLPEPSSEYGSLYTNDADDLYLTVRKVSFSEYETYVEGCIDKGYTFVVESSSSSYTAFNSDGYELELDYYEDNEVMDISLDVRISGTIKWSNSKLATLLPVPKSNIGSIVNDYTYGYEVYVGNTSKAEFDTYISECEARGFNLNVQKQDDSFYAENELGYELTVEYIECELIYINLDVPEDVADDEESDETNNSGSDGDVKNNDSLSSVEKEIDFVISLFYQKKSAVLSDYPNATEDGSNVLIEGTFAGMDGKYNVCTSDGEVYKVLFIRNDGVTVSDDVINAICEYLGDYIEYDEEWNKYEWATNKLELSLYADERVYFEPAYEDNSDDDASTNQGDNDSSSKKLTDSEIEDLAIQTLYKQLLAYENNYHDIDAASCRYEINKIVRDDGSVEVYGMVYFYDKYGSITKFGKSYSSDFTIHMTEWGDATWCEM